MFIDMSELPLVEECLEKGKSYLQVSRSNRNVMSIVQATSSTVQQSQNSVWEFYGPIEVKIPAAIPPFPIRQSKVLYLIERTKDHGIQSSIKEGHRAWCLKNSCGHFQPLNALAEPIGADWDKLYCKEICQRELP